MARLLFNVLGRSSLAVIGFCAAVLHSSLSLAAPPVAYQVPQPSIKVTFPRDHGAHPEFRTEWWYLTGHLVRKGMDPFKDGADFGFQITFFRRGVGESSSPSQWNQQFLAHAAVSDVGSKRFQFDKRYSRGGLPLAEASAQGLDVRNGPWSMVLDERGFRTEFSVERKDNPAYRVMLRAAVVPEPLKHGQDGFSRKGRCDGCASMYYSLPGIRIEGEVTRAGERIPVVGSCWLDHEWMSGAIDPNQIGWDWLSLMHRDGRSVMLFQLRDKAGKVDFGSGTVADGAAQSTLTPEQFGIQGTDSWKSGVTGISYPSGWLVKLPGVAEFNLEPLLLDQEISGEGNQYWEGAVATPERDWIGYAELTGYGEPVGAF